MDVLDHTVLNKSHGNVKTRYPNSTRNLTRRKPCFLMNEPFTLLSKNLPGALPYDGPGFMLVYALNIYFKKQFKKQCEQLGTKVKSRVQQAEANRILLLKASTQRRAAESLRKKLARERKYKECVYEAIYRKSEKKRAHDRLLKVQQVAWFVCNKREIEREDEGHVRRSAGKAKKQRAEYLRQRRNLNTHQSSKSKMMNEQGEYLSRKLARCWRRFVKLRKTTFSLAKACLSLGIDEKFVKTIPFEDVAHRMELTTTIQTVKAFVGCLECRLMISQAVIGSRCNTTNIDHLLQYVAFPTHRDSSSKVSRGGVKSIKPGNKEAQKLVKLSRYPVKVSLYAYIIIGHPDIVFSRQSECETTPAESTANFIQEFELLIKIIINGPIRCAKCSYLQHFVDWTSTDAKLLERDLVRAACQLELSTTRSGNASKDKALKEQTLLRESVKCPSGVAEVGCMHSLSDMHTKASEKNHMHTKASNRLNSENFQKSSTHLSERSSVSISCNSYSLTESCQRSGNKGGPYFDIDGSFFCPYFDIDGSFLVKGVDFLPSRNATGVTDRGLSLNLMFSENELLVNEIIHKYQSAFANGLDVAHEDHNSLKDGVLESMKNDDLDFSWVLKLMKEVRDELYEIETIDVDILEQMLKSGEVDMAYLRSILEFALITLRKLSAPANDEAMIELHNKILRELGEVPLPGDESKVSYVLSIIKGLHFTLQEIQILKREISQAQIKLLEPVIRGPASLEHLIISTDMAFANRHGPQWLSSVSPYVEQEWHEHMDYLCDFTKYSDSSENLFPSTLWTRGTTYSVPEIRSSTSNAVHDQPECPKEPMGLLVRLSLLKLVNRVEGLTPEDLPETLKLNVFRFRTVQFILLFMHASLPSKNLVTNSADVEYIVSQCFERLCKLLDDVEEVGLSDIIEKIMSIFSATGDWGVVFNVLWFSGLNMVSVGLLRVSLNRTNVEL
ncbi:hypothetical protein K2173_006829 [Erythroxylum novogranatense]|uniref:Uncharacterized protein n=1 Tax=Erythroxylum novogranatense TaxID=1862640 RepID=A0AAV8SZ33_9ROSI|nr:hypothetical protein K2173_006829 [Erythroxylum novogranatense]